jgi:hypothetical protein
MGHFHIDWKRNKKNYQIIEGYANKNSIKKQGTIQNIEKQHPRRAKYNKSGMYQLKYFDYPQKYVGQTGRLFHTRYKGYIQAVRNNNSNSGYLNHILNTGQKYCSVLTCY